MKDTKKPKIEYRTSVIYKQSCEQGESDEDGDNEEGSEAQDLERNDTSGKQSEERRTNSQPQQEANNQTPAEDLNQQIDSIKAAEIIGTKPSVELVALDMHVHDCLNFLFIMIIYL